MGDNLNSIKSSIKSRAPSIDALKSEIRRRAPSVSSIRSGIKSEIKRRTAKKRKPGLRLTEMLKSGGIALADLQGFKTSSTVREAYSLTLETAPGKALDAMLYLPKGKAPYPAVLFNYGIGPNMGFGYLAKHLTLGGWAVLVPAYEGCLKLQPVPDDVDSVVAAFRFLRSLDVVKPESVGIIGGSYGAALAVCGAADRRIRDDVRYVVSIDSPADVRDVLKYAKSGSRVGYRLSWLLKKKLKEFFLEKIKEYRARRGPRARDDKVLMGLYKDYYLATELLQAKEAKETERLFREFSPYTNRQIDRISPIKHVGGLKAPSLFVHGSEDIVVPAEHSRLLHKKMLALGKESELIIIEGLGHGVMIGNPRALIAYLRKEGRATLRRVTGFMRR